MRAVNLVPQDARRGGAPSLGRLGASHVLIAVLLIAVGYVTFYVLTTNQISQRQAQLAGLQQQVVREQAVVARFASYKKFEKLAQARAQTVRQIAASRFDWYSALEDLSKVVPTNTTLQSLTATVSPTATTGAGASASGGIRGAISAPAFDLTGCTGSQDEVAQLMSRLRLINGVTRVTLGQSSKAAPGSGSTTTTPTTGSAHSCAGGPSFEVVVFFQPQSNPLPTTPGAAK